MTCIDENDMTTAFIVVGVDGSPTSLSAHRWAGKQAELTGATVQAVTGWEYPYSYVGYPVAAGRRLAGQRRAHPG